MLTLRRAVNLHHPTTLINCKKDIEIMKKMRMLLCMAAAGLMLGGCVSQKKYAELDAKYQSMQQEYQSTRESLVECNANGKSMEEIIRQARKENADLKEAYNSLKKSLDQSIYGSSANISKLVDEINASNKYIKQLVEAKSKSDSLNMVLTNNLTRSLSREELKDVDVKVLKGDRKSVV